ADKTNWRAMLKGNAEPVDLKAEGVRLTAELKEKLDQLITEHGASEIEFFDGDVVNIDYPVNEFPVKITSHNFDKNPLVSGQLKGIKGQYLLLDTGVINIRKFTSYEVEFSY
ncbi:MAG: DUF2797 domain-containing protein, partial [Gammaproteobacteria bacterium]|nr:DUF2797 domain-containing protein [Gammaproteobacteria bacterium]